MPEYPGYKRERPTLLPIARGPSRATTGSNPSPPTRPAPRYAELHAKTNFSFLEGASHPDEMVRRAAELGLAGLAITDRESLAGMVRAHVAAKEAGLRLIVGAELRPIDAGPVLVWVKDRGGYGRLCRLLTLGRRRVGKGECRIEFADLCEHAEGLVVGVLFPPRADAPPTVERVGRLSVVRPPDAPSDAVLAELLRYREVFGDRCYAVAELFRGPDDERRLATMLTAARRARTPALAANDVHFHDAARAPLQDCLAAIRHGTVVADAAGELFPNAQRRLHSPVEMAEAFAPAPDLLERTLEVLERCPFSLEELRYEYPEELCPKGRRPIEYLVELAWRGAADRYPDGVPEKVRRLLEHELALIEELRYEAYFLTVWDLVRFARSRGILCQGRGSAANSAVCFCLGVTAVDPARIDVLFERFVSRERQEAPDIDVDFEHERREEVLQYLYEKYGRDRAGIAAEVITYQPRSAVRDVGKALGLSADRIDALAKSLEGYRDDGDLPSRCRQSGIDPASPIGRRLLSLVEEILDFPRHLSQHVGGMVMTRGPLCELIPIENAAMPGRTVVQWDKDDLDALGILKVDVLALGMLTAIRKCFELIERHHGRRLTLADVPPEDPEVYRMISKADTLGVFQIESRAQMSMLPRLRPRCFYDLVIEVAIVRPGPIQGDMVHPYLRRRAGEEPVEYPNDAVRAVLEKTLGVPLFQEQAMRLAVVAAGFSPGEADQLRRAMAAWRRTGVMEKFRQKLIDGMLANGLSLDFAERLFRQIQGFGEYGFPESHAASFALLVYVSAWLKRYYPAAFAAALLSSQPMGFYAPAQIVRDAQSHGVEIGPIDVHSSEWDHSLEAEPSSVGGVRLRLGLRLIAGLSRRHADAIAEARRAGPFRSLEELARRGGLSRAVVARLAGADAFGSLSLGRRAALWESLACGEELPLFSSAPGTSERETAAAPPRPMLPSLSPFEEVLADYRSAGLSLKAHPVSFLRPELERLFCVKAAELATLPSGKFLKAAGIVLMRQRPATAKGIRFVTLEDETGIVNLVIRPKVWERCRRAAARAPALLAAGWLERKHEVIHLVVVRVADLSARLAELRTKSRDFR